MGVTGSGKSTFINTCVEQEVEVGHSLKSCKRLSKPICSKIAILTTLYRYTGTDRVGIATFKYNGQIVNLIDTPGFDDTFRSDTDVLKDIAV